MRRRIFYRLLFIILIQVAAAQSPSQTSSPSCPTISVECPYDYLVKQRGIEEGRVIIIDGGYSTKPKVELWIVPTGAEPPKPSPSN